MANKTPKKEQRPMSRDEFERIFKRLDEVVAELHYIWKEYRKVFTGRPEDVAILNQSGSNFLYIVQHSLLDQVALMFSKLTDRNKQRSDENLSLAQVNVYASDNGDLDLVKDLKELLDHLKEGCERFRVLRNKRIAHSDLNHELNIHETPLEGISMAYVEEALDRLDRFMNRAEGYYFNRTTAYGMTAGPVGAGGQRFMSVLDAGVQALEK
ncbi:hypothetical protein [Thalassolituus pacificus]|uniref:HEPN AbiU2-like domain-containing protein n=1 Tax=Thalassolituus pacificus TaxID=2975440 RepID=A0A9X3AQ61_9GAMM|nr:hypothetical protein [Thalassolituus pacificus]MCT7357544.1 hypothetical protein [Thalassolituus pacificus]